MVLCSSSSNNKPSCSSLSFLLSGLGVLHGVGMRKIWWAVWHENVTINTVQYSNLPHYTIIFDIRMEHFKDLCGMLTYHALPCNVTITLYAFQVMWVYCLHIRYVNHWSNICIVLVHANQYMRVFGIALAHIILEPKPYYTFDQDNFTTNKMTLKWS